MMQHIESIIIIMQHIEPVVNKMIRDAYTSSLTF